MARTLKYSTLDVFTSTPFAGNQLGIVVLDEDNPDNEFTYDKKLTITREFNYSETIFIHPFNKSKATRQVDIFTPEAEIPFGGHPTIGAISFILEHLPSTLDNTAECLLQLKAGIVKGSLDRNTGFASAEIPHNVHIHSNAPLNWDRLIDSQPALSNPDLEPSQQFKQQTHALVSIVKGVNFALIDLTNAPNLLPQVEITNKYVANPTDLDQDWPTGLTGSLFYVRRPEQEDGIIRIDQRVIVIGLKDPATGAASCALCAYLALQEGGGSSTYKFELEQGTQMGRKSIIRLEVTLDEEGGKVEKLILSGQTRLVMNGELFL